MSVSKSKIHLYIYIGSIILLAIALPLSKFLMSVSQIFLLLNWIVEANFRKKFEILKQNKKILLLISIYILHLIGLIYTSDFNYALRDIRIKLPLLLLPLIIGSSRSLTNRQLRLVLLFFIAAVTIGSLVSTSILTGIVKYEFSDIREISIFISHIRFALLINVAVFSLVFILFLSNDKLEKRLRQILHIVLVWLIVFLFLLQSLTGIVILLITGSLVFIINIKKLKPKILKLAIISLLLITPISIGSYIYYSINKFYTVENIDFNNLETKTSKGNLYHHDINNKNLENGYYVGLYFCEQELRNTWNKRSNLKYDSLDNLKQNLKYTLARYLTSKGYRKDADGVQKLTTVDTENIEMGYANYIYRNKLNISTRIYQVIWEIDVYLNGGNPSYHSITQRFEYMKAAISVIKNNFWIGTGTGDVQKSYNKYYKESNSILVKKRWKRVHNQLVTFFLTFGIIGFLWVIFALFYIIFWEFKTQNFLFLVFFAIAFLSMLNEDTLETQTGATFFAFFCCLFIGLKNNNKLSVI